MKFIKFAQQAQKITQLTCTRVFFNRNNLNQHFASRVNSPEHLQPPMVGRQLWPFPSTSNSFYRPSELTRMQFHEQQLEDSSQLRTIHNNSDVSRAQSPISVASNASTASLQSEEERPKGKTKKARSKFFQQDPDHPWMFTWYIMCSLLKDLDPIQWDAG